MEINLRNLKQVYIYNVLLDIKLSPYFLNYLEIKRNMIYTGYAMNNFISIKIYLVFHNQN